MCIVDSRDQVLRHKIVKLVLVLWRHYGVEESTWEREDAMQATYPFLFRDEGIVDRIRVCSQVHNTIIKGLLSNPRKTAP